jgi:hypothetical protein
MKSFAVAIEPPAQPRLAALALAVHAVAAASPWLAHVAPPAAAALSLIALSGLVATLSRVPGRHCRLAAVAFDARGCRARIAGASAYGPACFGAGSRALPCLVSLELDVDGCRLGWLLPGWALAPGDFRRLRARIRMAC